MVLILDALLQRLRKFQRGGGQLDDSITFHMGKFKSGVGGGKSVSLIPIQLMFKEKILF